MLSTIHCNNNTGNNIIHSMLDVFKSISHRPREQSSIQFRTFLSTHIQIFFISYSNYQGIYVTSVSVCGIYFVQLNIVFMKKLSSCE